MMIRKTKPMSLRRGAVHPRLIVELAILLAVVAALVYILTKRPAHGQLPVRPSDGRLLVDTANLFRFDSETTESFLEVIRDRYQIEAMIVTLRSLHRIGTIEEAATKIMSAWKIGNRYGNRGILLVYSKAEKEVKVEVSYELEDVFTDLFVGSAEDLQLKPHFRAGNPGTGLSAVMEEIDIRADIKKQHQYTEDTIRALDARFASGGAGAVWKLKAEASAKKQGPGGAVSFELSPGPSIFPDSALLTWKRQKDPKFQPGRTPGEAYEIMKAAFRAHGDQRNINFFNKQEGKPYEVLQNENRAVIYFGEDSADAYQPWLLARTEEGWIFDYINQSRYVLYSLGNRWMIGLGDHEYQGLFDQRRFYSTMAVDIPWSEDDLYHAEDDRRLVQRTLKLEKLYQEKPDDFETALELGRLATLIRRHLNLVIPCLERAKTLNPASPMPYKYAAAAYITLGFEPNKATQELRELLKRDPGNLFGRKFLGYVSYLVKDYDSAVDELRKVLETDARDCYAVSYLGYSLAERYNIKGSPGDKQAALEALRICMLEACGPSMQRPWMLMTKLERDGLMPGGTMGASVYWRNYRSGQGVLIYDVQRGKPAEQAGLEPGDFIMCFNGQPVHSSWELMYLVAICQPGQLVNLEIVRGALKGPETLGDGITVTPRTFGLNPPQSFTLDVTVGRREPR